MIIIPNMDTRHVVSISMRKQYTPIMPFVQLNLIEACYHVATISFLGFGMPRI